MTMIIFLALLYGRIFDPNSSKVYIFLKLRIAHNEGIFIEVQHCNFFQI